MVVSSRRSLSQLVISCICSAESGSDDWIMALVTGTSDTLSAFITTRDPLDIARLLTVGYLYLSSLVIWP